MVRWTDVKIVASLQASIVHYAERAHLSSEEKRAECYDLVQIIAFSAELYD